jgi:hypothetical protein
MTQLRLAMLTGATALFACNDSTSASAGSEAGSGAAETSAAGTTTTTSTPPTSTTAASGGSTTMTTAVDTTADAGASESTDSGDVALGEVRFVALGDAGEGNEAQAAVGQMIATVCEERGCDFALYLGDNFYDVGVSSADDVQFETKFQTPYEPVDLTFHITLGNHDYGTLGNEWAKAAYYLEYSAANPKFSLPSEYYSFQAEHAHFVSLDTNRVFWSYELDAQRQWLKQDLAGLSGWKIAFGHHPYISNGEHGNAGNYEGLGGIFGGGNVRDFFEEEVCGKFDVYISGHDHSRQWLTSDCGTEFILSGAGAKLDDLPNRDGNTAEFTENTTEGFLWVEVVDDSFTGVFFDVMGNAQYERTITL